VVTIAVDAVPAGARRRPASRRSKGTGIGGTSVARHPFVLPDVRDLGSDGEDGEEHAPDQDDDPFGLDHDSLANAATLALVEAQTFHQRRGTHRGGSPSS
jgi:hypothetical protein